MNGYQYYSIYRYINYLSQRTYFPLMVLHYSNNARIAVVDYSWRIHSLLEKQIERQKYRYRSIDRHRSIDIYIDIDIIPSYPLQQLQRLFLVGWRMGVYILDILLFGNQFFYHWLKGKRFVVANIRRQFDLFFVDRFGSVMDVLQTKENEKKKEQ